MATGDLFLGCYNHYLLLFVYCMEKYLITESIAGVPIFSLMYRSSIKRHNSVLSDQISCNIAFDHFVQLLWTTILINRLLLCFNTMQIHRNWPRSLPSLWFSIVTATPPPQRPWIPLARPNRSRPTCIFTVMCYNVLCDKYATRQMYGYCPGWALAWEYRKKVSADRYGGRLKDIFE